MEDVKVAGDDMAADSNVENLRGETPSYNESSPEADADVEPSQEPAQPQKRKGGRKPIYATSEERKQRNRQAQAAFRERRTDYIKQLEASVKHHEDSLNTLQQSHRTAADECLMLRYKNSLLERILLEKGIDVQAELSLKTGSPTLSFQHPGANIPQIPPPQPPLQRTAIQRHQARRSGQFLPKLAPGSSNSDTSNQRSPQANRTPSSHVSSPASIATRSPMLMQTAGSTPPTSAGLSQPQLQQKFQQGSQHPPNQRIRPNQMSPMNRRPDPPAHHHQSSNSIHSSYSASGRRQSLGQPGSATFGNPSVNRPGSQQLYSDPFQKHVDQLEQEYDAQHTRSMLDHTDGDDHPHPSIGRLQGQYPPQYDHQQRSPHRDYYHPSIGMQHDQPSGHPQGVEGQFAPMGELIDPNDPMLDADPFGLSASMHYPTAYSFEQPTTR